MNENALFDLLFLFKGVNRPFVFGLKGTSDFEVPFSMLNFSMLIYHNFNDFLVCGLHTDSADTSYTAYGFLGIAS